MNKKKTNFVHASLFLSAMFLATTGQMFQASGQNATPNQALTPEQQAAKIKEHWSKPLNDARADFQNSNDRESADFVTGILDSFESSAGMSPTALGNDLERIKRQVRELVRHGALESAASLNWALWLIANRPGAPQSKVRQHARPRRFGALSAV